MVDPFTASDVTLRDVVAYIDAHLKRTAADHEVAYAIAALMSIPKVETMRGDADLDEILELAGGLEIPSEASPSRKKSWRLLHAALGRLRERTR